MEKPQSLTQRLRDCADKSPRWDEATVMRESVAAIEELVGALEASSRILSGSASTKSELIAALEKSRDVLAKYGSRHDNTPNDVSTNGAERE
jgi:hypothetical protein